jgi:hypothetical protein
VPETDNFQAPVRETSSPSPENGIAPVEIPVDDTPSVAEPVQGSDQDAELAWLESLAGKQASAVEAPEIQPASPVEGIAETAALPDETTQPEAAVDTNKPAPAPAVEEEEHELPEWLKFLDAESPAAENAPVETQPAENLAKAAPAVENAWTTEGIIPVEEPAAPAEASPAEVVDVFTPQSEQPDAALAEPASPEALGVESTPPASREVEPSLDDVSDWLSKLEQSTPSTPETPLAETLPPSDEMPAPVKPLAENKAEEVIPSTGPAEEDEDKTQVVYRGQPVKMPDWLQDFEADRTEPIGQPQAAPQEPSASSVEEIPGEPTIVAGAPEQVVATVQQPEEDTSEIIPSEVPPYISAALKASDQPIQNNEPPVYEEEPETPLPEQSAYEEPAQITPAFDAASLNDNLVAAQASLQHGHVKTGLLFYEQVIKNGYFLDETIHDLRDALYRYPVDITIWQALGDAYVRSNRIQEALDAYTKAEELLR